MRRLPIFLLVDVSESMVGEALYRLEDGIRDIAAALRKDPYALECAWLSVIVFAGRARTLVPLTELFAFQPPELPVGGGTALGRALDHLMDEIGRSVVTATGDRRGDWEPIVFLLTDGHPTDTTAPAVARWNRDFRRRAGLVAVSVGGAADHGVLKRLTDDVLVLDDTAPDAFARFIRWISQSIQATSQRVAGGAGGVSLSKTEGTPVTPAEAGSASPFHGVDDRYAVFLAKCARTGRPYLVRYQRHIAPIETSDPTLARLIETRRYVLDAAVPVKASYFELTEDGGSGQSVTTTDLVGQPHCPHCQAPFGMAVCRCGGIHCVAGDGEAVCPWCHNTGWYSAMGPDSGGIDLSRGRG